VHPFGHLSLRQPRRVARLEGQAHRASLRTIKSYAQATGHKVVIRLERVVGKG